MTAEVPAADLSPEDVCLITIPDATLIRRVDTGDNRIELTFESGTTDISIICPATETSEITFMKKPDNWPPQPGELWQSRANGIVFAAHRYVAELDHAYDSKGCDADGVRTILVPVDVDHTMPLGAAWLRPEAVFAAHKNLVRIFTPEVQGDRK